MNDHILIKFWKSNFLEVICIKGLFDLRIFQKFIVFPPEAVARRCSAEKVILQIS